MIDSFWTKWRIRQLARGENLLVGQWLEDYARWLYGRLWYRCLGQKEQAQQLLEEIFVSAAGQLKEFTSIRGSMSEWLLFIYEQLTANLPATDKPPQPGPQIRKAVWSLAVQPISEAEPLCPELAQYSQRALAMLSCDHQRVLVCRYCHLERLANTAAQYNCSLPEIQALLYKASHSFRRGLEALAQTGAEEISQTGRSDSTVLETNLEKIFCSLVLESPSPEIMIQLKERITTVLTHNKQTNWSGSTGKFYLFGGFIIVCAIIIFFVWQGKRGPFVSPKENTSQEPKMNTQQNVSQVSTPDAAQEVQTAVQLGKAQDVEGLMGILRTGTFPAQIAAAYYLGRYGDKSAINLLDQAAQKWYAQNPAGKNPFLEAIEAIETRMRQQMQEELKAAQIPPVKESAVQIADSILGKRAVEHEPNVLSPTQKKPVLVEPNLLPQEPNQPQPLLMVHVEPNEPPIIEEYVEYPAPEEPNEPALAEEVNQLLPVDEVDMPLYENPNL